MMMEEPAKVMKFYTEESAFSFASGTTEEAVSKNVKVLQYNVR